MTEVITQQHNDTNMPTKRPVGRPRKPIDDDEELAKINHTEYVKKRREASLKCYHNKKQLKTKYTCGFINYKGGHCNKTSYHEYCSIHRRMLADKDSCNK